MCPCGHLRLEYKYFELKYSWGCRPNYLLSSFTSQDTTTCQNNTTTYRKFASLALLLFIVLSRAAKIVSREATSKTCCKRYGVFCCPLSEAVVRTVLILTSNEHIVMFRRSSSGFSPSREPRIMAANLNATKHNTLPVSHNINFSTFSNSNHCMYTVIEVGESRPHWWLA